MLKILSTKINFTQGRLAFQVEEFKLLSFFSKQLIWYFRLKNLLYFHQWV